MVVCNAYLESYGDNTSCHAQRLLHQWAPAHTLHYGTHSIFNWDDKML